MKLKALASFSSVAVLVTFVLASAGLVAAAMSAAGRADVPALSETLFARFGEWMGGEVTRRGTVCLKSFLNMALEAENVEIKGSKRFDTMLRLKAGKLSARMHWLDVIMGRPNFGEITLENVVVEVSAPPALAGNGETSPILLGPGGFTPLFDVGGADVGKEAPPFSSVHINNARVVFVSRPHTSQFNISQFVGGSPRRAYPQLIISSLRISIDQDGALDVTGDAGWRGQPFSIAARKGAPGWGQTGAPFEAQLGNGLFNLSATGELTSGADHAPQFRGEASLASTNTAEAARWLGFSAPGESLGGSFAVEGRVNWKSRELSINHLQAVANTRKISGALMVRDGGARPEVEGTLALSEFDLASLTGAEAGVARLPNADLRVSVKKFSAGGVSGGAAALTLLLRDGKLSADLADLALLGGRVRGHFALDASQPQRRLTVRATATDLDSAELSRVLNMTGWLSGDVNLNVEARAEGGDWPALLRTLSGEAKVAFADGGGVGLDLRQFVGAEGAGRWSAAQGDQWSWEERGFMKFDALRGEFAIDHGRIRSKSFELSTGDQEVAGSCFVDLAGQSIDWRFDIRPVEPAAGNGVEAPGNVATTAFAPSVIIKGPWQSPSVQVNDPDVNTPAPVPEGTLPSSTAPPGKQTG